MCGSLTHSERLKQLAAEAAACVRADSPRAARDLWTQALELLPAHSQQHAVIRDRVAELTRAIEGTSAINAHDLRLASRGGGAALPA